MKSVNIKGKTELGTIATVNYVMFDEDSYTAIKKALEYADREYNALRDENGKVIKEYKEYVEILSIEFVTE